MKGKKQRIHLFQTKIYIYHASICKIIIMKPNCLSTKVKDEKPEWKKKKSIPGQEEKSNG
jgi:hypothetical protein